MRIRTFVALLLLLVITAGVVFVLRPNQTILQLPMEIWGRLVPVWGVILGSFAAGTLIALVLQVSGLGRNAIRRAQSLLSARRREAVVKEIEKGRRAEREGRCTEAIAAYREAAGLGGGSFEAFMRLGDLLRRTGETAEAVTAHEEARRIEPLNDEPGHALALDLLEMGEFNRARQELTSLVEKNPKGAIGPLRQLRELEIEAGDWTAASKAARRLDGIVSSKDPATEEDRIQGLGIRTELARAKAEEGEQRTALGLLRRIIKDAPEYVPARLLLSDLAGEGTDREPARESLLEGFQLTGEGVLLECLAEGDLHLERPEDAISTLRGLIAVREHENTVRCALGKLYLRLEMLDEASEQLSLLHEATDGAALPTMLLARVEQRRGEDFRAAELFCSVLETPDWRVHEYGCSACKLYHEQWNHRCQSCGTFGSIAACS